MSASCIRLIFNDSMNLFSDTDHHHDILPHPDQFINAIYQRFANNETNTIDMNGNVKYTEQTFKYTLRQTTELKNKC